MRLDRGRCLKNKITPNHPIFRGEFHNGEINIPKKYTGNTYDLYPRCFEKSISKRNKKGRWGYFGTPGIKASQSI
jgi:hypothetical protein